MWKILCYKGCVWLFVSTMLWTPSCSVPVASSINEDAFSDSLSMSGDHIADSDIYHHSILTGDNYIPEDEDGLITVSSPENTGDKRETTSRSWFSHVITTTSLPDLPQTTTPSSSTLGDPCVDNCDTLPNGICIDEKCQCASGFYQYLQQCTKLPEIQLKQTFETDKSMACKNLNPSTELCLHWTLQGIPAHKTNPNVTFSAKGLSIAIKHIAILENNSNSIEYEGRVSNLSPATVYNATLTLKTELWSTSTPNAIAYTAPTPPKGNGYQADMRKLTFNISYIKEKDVVLYLSACPVEKDSQSECSFSSTEVIDGLHIGTQYSVSITLGFHDTNSTISDLLVWTAPEVFEFDVDTEHVDGKTEAYLEWEIPLGSFADKFYLTWGNNNNVSFDGIAGVYSYNYTCVDLSPGHTYDFMVTAVITTDHNILTGTMDYSHTTDPSPAVIESIKVVDAGSVIVTVASDPLMTGEEDEYQFVITMCSLLAKLPCVKKTEKVKYAAKLALEVNDLEPFNTWNVSVISGVFSDWLKHNPAQALDTVSLRASLYVEIMDMKATENIIECSNLNPNMEACITWWSSLNVTESRQLQIAVTATDTLGRSVMLTNLQRYGLSGKYNLKATGLMAGMGYNYTVKVFTESSSIVNSSQPYYTVPLNPFIGKVFNVTETTITLEWMVNETVVNSFYVEMYEDMNQYRSKKPHDVIRLPVNVTGPRFSGATLIDLTPGHEYIFVILSAITCEGKDIYASRDTGLKISNNTRPNAPSDFKVVTVTSSSLEFLFTNSSPADSFNVAITPHHNMIQPKVTLYSNHQHMVDISDLSPGVSYTASINAVMGVWHSKSLDVNFTTNEIAPSEPTNFTLNYINSTTLEVVWLPPSHINGNLLGYYVDIWQGNRYTLNWSLLEKVHSQQSEYINEKLWPGYCYSVSVSAYNTAGNGPWTTNITKATPETAPSKPQIIHPSTNGSHQVKIAWNPPSQPNGIIRNYTLTTLDDNGKQQSICFLCCNCPLHICFKGSKEIAAPDDCMKKEMKGLDYCDKVEMFKFKDIQLGTSVKNLHAYSHYSLKVEACTVAGCSYSQVDISTKQDAPSTPRSFTVLPLSSTSIYINWTEPAVPNGVIQYYRVFYSAEYNNAQWKQEQIKSSETHLILTGLNKFTKYMFYIRGYTTKMGNRTSTVYCTTMEDVPSSPPSQFSLTTINATAIRLHWSPPLEPNGIILNYDITYSCQDEERTLAVSGASRELLIGTLKYWTEYSFSLAAKTVKGLGPTIIKTKTTAEYIPTSPVTGVKAVSKSGTNINLQWTPPVSPNGRITHYKITYECKAHVPSSSQILTVYINTSTNDNVYNLTGLDYFWWYTITVDVFTAVGKGTESSQPAHIQTAQGVPGKPENFIVVPLNSTSLQLSWDAPVFPNGVIVSYAVLHNKSELVFPSQIMSTVITGLKIWTVYQVSVFARTAVGNGQMVSLISRTTEAAPARPDVSSSEPAITEAEDVIVLDPHLMAAINLPMNFFTDSSYGQPLAWGVVVMETAIQDSTDGVIEYKDGRAVCKGCVTWDEYHNKGVRKPYRATPTGWKPQQTNHSTHNGRGKRSSNMVFVLGEDKDCREFCNGYLKAGTSYRVKAFVCNGAGCTDTFYSKPVVTDAIPEPTSNHSAIAGAVMATFLVVTIIVVLGYLKRTRKGPFGKKAADNAGIVIEESSEESSEMDDRRHTRSIALVDLALTVEKLKRSSNFGFAEEYKDIKDLSPKHPHNASELEVNRSKNRYTNILPFDHSRVKLLPLDDEEGSDYINASYIPGYNSKREYIAAQGPLPGTKDDFWRMIWEQNVSVIVMVTKCMEARGRVKCEQYWPNDDDPVYFGELIVQRRSESILPEYDIRILDIRLGESKKRTIKHFHFLKWPDFGCPKSTKSVVNFVYAVQSHKPPINRGPVLVHCSAGVGRTGTYIAVDCLLQQIRDHDEVDIFGRVLEMREHRTHMVQTEDQYIYIHDCVLDAFKSLQHDGEDNTMFEDESGIYENIELKSSRM